MWRVKNWLDANKFKKKLFCYYDLEETMEEKSIENIIKSTIHIVMIEPENLRPVKVGSGCLINYQNRNIVLTVAHVTAIEAGTCIDTGHPPVDNRAPLYSVGAMNYLEKFDITRYDDLAKSTPFYLNCLSKIFECSSIMSNKLFV